MQTRQVGVEATYQPRWLLTHLPGPRGSPALILLQMYPNNWDDYMVRHGCIIVGVCRLCGHGDGSMGRLSSRSPAAGAICSLARPANGYQSSRFWESLEFDEMLRRAGGLSGRIRNCELRKPFIQSFAIPASEYCKDQLNFMARTGSGCLRSNLAHLRLK